MQMIQRVLFVAAFFASFEFAAAHAHAGRVVTFEILLDGQIVLQANRLDQGEPANTAWNYLKSLPVKNPAELYVQKPEEEERLKKFYAELDKQGPTKATLKGKCRIFCRYAGDVTVDELRLVRKDPRSPWYIDPMQVDQLAKKRVIDREMRTRDQVDSSR